MNRPPGGPPSSAGGRAAGLPRWVSLVDGDNVLPVDLDNVVSVDTFVRTVRHRDGVLLEELYPGPDELVASSPEGDHAVEVVVPLLSDRPITPAPTAERAQSGASFRPARSGPT